MTGADWVIYGSIALLVAVLGLGFYSEVTSEKFYLRKDQWECTSKHLDMSMIPVITGNTTTMVPHYTEACDQWSARK